ncbi:hypothetical protein C5Y93_06245 [Blastopirellula marina]|uniref:Uncharacterized protein n=1 Tax=Blastopirellula marina TaxID=124 RepID=A0A2S8GRP0_9BACT|nr:hypothetical protein C5Y93_06245 [Blastopirellula marina]
MNQLPCRDRRQLVAEIIPESAALSLCVKTVCDFVVAMKLPITLLTHKLAVGLLFAANQSVTRLATESLHKADRVRGYEKTVVGFDDHGHDLGMVGKSASASKGSSATVG